MEPTSPFIQAIHPRGFLSFAPDCDPIELRSLNVLIGPNGAGKSNFIELIDFLRSTPTDLAGLVRESGGGREWLWKGEPKTLSSRLAANVHIDGLRQTLRYEIEVGISASERLEVLDEKIENTGTTELGADRPYFYYQFQQGNPVINVKSVSDGENVKRRLNRDTLDPQQSVLAQRKDPESFPELTTLGKQFQRMMIFREWAFGRNTPLRQAQSTSLPTDTLLPDGSNLGLILNHIEHSDEGYQLNRMLSEFLPRFSHFSVRIQSGNVQIFLHEKGLLSPVPATRLSDGTIRFITLLVILLKPQVASLVCLEEPELGLHPDAIVLLARLLKQASSRCQLIVTSHSDILLSELAASPEDVLVCENISGRSYLKRLKPEKLDAWLDSFTLGEVWRNGELGGNP